MAKVKEVEECIKHLTKLCEDADAIHSHIHHNGDQTFRDMDRQFHQMFDIEDTIDELIVTVRAEIDRLRVAVSEAEVPGT